MIPALLLALTPVSAAPSTYFSLSDLVVTSVKDGERLSGTVCRRAGRTGLTPTRLQVEQRDGGGQVMTTQFVPVAALSRRADQHCARVGARLQSAPAPVASVRVCFARRGACPS